MTEKLTRRGLRVPSDYHADILRTTEVGTVMTATVQTVHRDAPLGEVARRFRAKGHSAYPVVDDEGRCVGIVSRGDLLDEADWNDDRSVGSIAVRDVVSVRSTDTLSDALELMLEERVEHLPVVDGDRLVGICTRTDVMQARRAQLVHEQPEPGWLSRRARPHEPA
jgi:CBS domain-containing protein